MSARKVSAVIVNHNTREDLVRCIRSLLADGFTDVLVGDAASSDGSAASVETEFPQVRVIALTVNRGFGATANVAIDAIQNPYVLLLNSDTLVEPGTGSALERYLNEHPRAAIVGPRLRESDGRLQPSCYPFPGTLRWILDNDVTAILARPFEFLRPLFLRAWRHDRPRTVPWIKGAAMAIRRSDFLAVRGFDEGYFLYIEETDLCARLWALGREIHFAPVADVVHLRERSTSQYGPRMMFLLCSSMERYFRTRYGTVRAGLLCACYRVLCSLRLARYRLHHA